jgi:ribosome-binding factor A
METIRQQKVSRLVQKEIGEIFQFDMKGHFGNVLITVTKVNVTKDMSIARVYLSIFAAPKKEDLFKAILASNKEIRRNLGNRVKNQLRIIPSLEFFIDDSLDYIEHIDKLLQL